MKKFLILCLLAISSLLFSTNTGFAQRTLGAPPPPPPATIDALANTPTDIPFDGGLSLVVIGGVAYAAKKGYDKRRKQKQE